MSHYNPSYSMRKGENSVDFTSAAAFLSMACTGLADGETVRDVLCPFCVGGRSQEKSFVVTRQGNILKYVCFRASCGKSGITGFNGSLVGETKNPLIKKASDPVGRPFQGDIAALTAAQARFLFAKYQLTPNELSASGVRYAPLSRRYVFPVRSPHYEFRGYMLRGYDGNLPKWDAFPEKYAETWLSWNQKAATKNPGGPIVIVEDQISALKVARNFVSVALLGTMFNHGKVAELITQGNKIVLALDADAWGKAIDSADAYKFYFDKMLSVVKLDKDLKYETDARINEIVMGAIKE